jgi:hypothetical protein
MRDNNFGNGVAGTVCCKVLREPMRDNNTTVLREPMRDNNASSPVHLNWPMLF